MIRRSLTTLATSALLLFALTGVAGAHASVYPKSMNAESYEKFTLRVPVEKESDTVKVRVEVPEGFAVSRVKPLPGWAYALEKGTDGKSVKAITWSGGKIAPGEFQEFEFQGKTAKDPGKYAFPAYQTYADGETVAWTGPSDAKTPASVVEVKATGAAVDAHGLEKPASTTTPPAEAKPAAPGAGAAPAPAPSPAASNPLTTGAAWGGLFLGGAALALALRRK